MKKYNGIKNLIILAIGIFLNANAQTIDEILPKIEIPKVATFQQPNTVNITTRNNQPKIPNIYNQNLSIQQRNALLIQQTDREIEHRRIQRRKLVQEAISEFETNKTNETNINYNLPSKAHLKGTEHYRKAYKELLAMDKNDYSVKDITFKVENAYYENTANKEEFNNTISEGTFCTYAALGKRFQYSPWKRKYNIRKVTKSNDL